MSERRRLVKSRLPHSGIDVFLEHPLDLTACAQSLGDDVPFQPVLGHALEGVGLRLGRLDGGQSGLDALNRLARLLARVLDRSTSAVPSVVQICLAYPSRATLTKTTRPPAESPEYRPRCSGSEHDERRRLRGKAATCGR